MGNVSLVIRKGVTLGHHERDPFHLEDVMDEDVYFVRRYQKYGPNSYDSTGYKENQYVKAVLFALTWSELGRMAQIEDCNGYVIAVYRNGVRVYHFSENPKLYQER